MWLYLHRETDLFQARLKLLHFAPERHARPVFRRLRNLDYVSADIDPAKGDVEIDIRRIAFDDASFDVILCSHVLEHIDDDRLAMRELLRVLKPGGVALLMTPYAPAQAVSLEDASVTSREGRLRLFGNETHFRIYGRDLADRLRDAGFEVTTIDFDARLSDGLKQRYALTIDEKDRTLNGYVHEDIIFRCVRPAAGNEAGKSG
jgi:SAM-dependent methyltransferase